MTIQVNHTRDAEKITTTILKAFQPLPFVQYINYNNSYDENYPKYLKRVSQFIEANAIIVEADDHSAVAIITPPTIEYPPLSNTDTRFEEISAKYDELSKKHPIGNSNKWTLVFLAKDPETGDRKGLISALVKPYLEKVKEEGGILVLKAINDHAKDVYEHYGFKVLGDPIVVGKGVVDGKTGLPDPHGTGVVSYSMVYNS